LEEELPDSTGEYGRVAVVLRVRGLRWRLGAEVNDETDEDDSDEAEMMFELAVPAKSGTEGKNRLDDERDFKRYFEDDDFFTF